MAEAGSVSRLSTRTLYGYGLGAVAQGVAGQALSTSIISQFLFLVVGMPALLVGAAIVVSQIVDAVVDPLLGLWSDRLRSPLARRHPFMYASAVPCAAAFYALWQPPTVGKLPPDPAGASPLLCGCRSIIRRAFMGEAN